MSLRLRYKLPPDIQILHRPPIRPAGEDVVRHDIVVTKCGHNWYDEVVRAMPVVVLPKDLRQLGDHELILLYDLLLRPRYLLVVVVPRRVARPYNKVYVILDVVVYPLKRLIDEREGRVAAGGFGAVDAGRTMFAVAGGVRCGARIRLVEWIWMEVWIIC